jgi:exosome complex component RRP4
MKQVVIPGELISAERKRLGSNVFVSDGKIYSRVLGISDNQGEVASVVALKGTYIPRREDTVIGVVSRVMFSGYLIDINSFTETFIPRKALREECNAGDIIVAKVDSVNQLREIDISYPKKLFGGELIEVEPVRSPRLIGKNASMLDVLTNYTGCEVFVGKNGRLWARGGNLELLKKAVAFINDNSYKSNLTNAVEELLKGEMK